MVTKQTKAYKRIRVPYIILYQINISINYNII